MISGSYSKYIQGLYQNCPNCNNTLKIFNDYKYFGCAGVNNNSAFYHLNCGYDFILRSYEINGQHYLFRINKNSIILEEPDENDYFTEEKILFSSTIKNIESFNFYVKQLFLPKNELIEFISKILILV